MQFVPCLSDLEAEQREKSALTPRRFAGFYSELFPLWREEFLRGNYVSVKFFDDLFNLLTGRGVTACGFNGSCNVQCVVEADGGVYPATSMCWIAGGWGNLREHRLTERSSTACKGLCEPSPSRRGAVQGLSLPQALRRRMPADAPGNVCGRDRRVLRLSGIPAAKGTAAAGAGSLIGKRLNVLNRTNSFCGPGGDAVEKAAVSVRPPLKRSKQRIA